MSSRSDRIRAGRSAGIAVLFGLGVSACASVGEPGVEIQAMQAEIAFGVELPEDEPLTPSTITVDPSSTAPILSDGGFTVPFRNRLPERFANVPFRIEPPEVPECPTARVGASPDQVAGEEVEGMPREGLYKWKRDVTLTRTVAGSEIEEHRFGFESRIIRGVEVVPGGVPDTSGQTPVQFSYELVRPDGIGNVIVDELFVNTDPVRQGANAPADPRGVTETADGAVQDAGGPGISDEAQELVPSISTVRVGEPNRGLSLTAQTTFDGNGQAQGNFDPQPPELLLPFPVQVGDFWNSTSTSASGQTVRIQGSVAERRAVDACGVLLDGWLAELEIVDASAEGAVQRHEELIVSTQFGGMIIGHHIVEEGTDEAGNPVRFEATYTLAQVDPDPLPAGAAE